MDLIADLLRIALLLFGGGVGLLAFVTGRLAVTSAPASANPDPIGMD